MRLTCIIALALALSAQPLLATAQDDPDAAPAWAPGAERRFARTLDSLKLKATDRPGEYRLAGDGRHPTDRLRRLVIARDGTLWVMRYRPPGGGASQDMIFRAGNRGGWTAGGGVRGARDMTSTPSGRAVLLRRSRFALLDDGRWSWSEPWPEDGPAYDLEVMDDGTVWVPHWARISRLDGSTWDSWSIDDLGVTFTLPFGEGAITGFGVRPDGTAWAGLTDRDARPAGLTRFDGDGWAEVTPFEGDERIAVAGLDVGADGTVWAVLVPDHDHARAHLARWDGEAWTAWRLPSLMSDKHGLPFGLQAAPDGRLWMLVRNEDPVVTQRFDATRMLFDGETWATLDMRVGDGRDLSLSFAPDGTVWYARGKTGYMVVPSELERLEVEAAQPYVPA